MENEQIQLTQQTAQTSAPSGMSVAPVENKNTLHMQPVVVMKAGVVLLIAGLVGFGLWNFLNGNSKKSKASESIATVKLSNTDITAQKNDTVRTNLTITTGGTTEKISAVDISFLDEGGGLDFLRESMTVPAGFEEFVLTDAQMAPATAQTNIRALTRITLVAKKTTAALTNTLSLSLSFKVKKGEPGEIMKLYSHIKSVQVSGPNAPGNLFTVKLDPTPLDFAVLVKTDFPTPTPDPRAAAVTNLTCDSNPGVNIMFKWSDSLNEDGYKIYKDGSPQPLATLGKGATSYLYNWCGDFGQHTYKVISYNTAGSVSLTEPSIQCSCKLVPTAPPPTPVPVKPTNSSDIILRLSLPDVAADVQTVANVKVEVYNGNVLACPSCTQTIMLTRSGRYFVSPQLSFNLTKTLPYTFVIKQQKSLRRTYKFVFLKYQDILNCTVAATSACGQLLTEIDSRPLLMGDIDGGMDSQNPGFNVINEVDLDKAQTSVDSKSDEGDVNFDGVSDVKDVGVVGKNFNQKGD
jgi:hypothetical protein